MKIVLGCLFVLVSSPLSGCCPCDFDKDALADEIVGKVDRWNKLILNGGIQSKIDLEGIPAQLELRSLSVYEEELPSDIDVITGRFDIHPAKYYEMRLERDISNSHHDRAIESMVALGDFISARNSLKLVTDEDTNNYWAARIEAVDGDLVEAQKLYLKLLGSQSRYKADARLEYAYLSRFNIIDLAAGFEIPEVRDQKQTSTRVLLQAELGGAIDWLKKQIVSGWLREDVRAHYTLSRLLSASGQPDTAIYAWFRARELANAQAEKTGQRNITSGKARKHAESYLFQLHDGTDWKGHFQKLQENADSWRARRLAYLEQALGDGKHPDTDPTFWEKQSLQPNEAGPAEVVEANKPLFTPGSVLALIGSILMVFAFVFVVLFVFWLRKRRGHAQP